MLSGDETRGRPARRRCASSAALRLATANGGLAESRSLDRALAAVAWVVVACIVIYSAVLASDLIADRGWQRPPLQRSSSNRLQPPGSLAVAEQLASPIATSTVDRTAPPASGRNAPTPARSLGARASSSLPVSSDRGAHAPATASSVEPRTGAGSISLEIGTFASAEAAVRLGVALGIPGQSFSPIPVRRSGRFRLRYGSFTGWKSAIGAMDRVRKIEPSLDVRLRAAGVPSALKPPSGRRALKAIWRRMGTRHSW